MSDFDPNVCSACGGSRFESCVQYGSYFMRCASCGTGSVATSFLALAMSRAAVFAYRDPGLGAAPQESGLVAKGMLSEIHEAISAVASRGGTVLLVWAAS
jgi:hypothetical protein